MNDEDYRKRAADAQRMADKVISDVDKAAWLSVASSWLALIRQPRQSASDKFDAAEKAQGTNQVRSEGEH